MCIGEQDDVFGWEKNDENQSDEASGEWLVASG